MIKTDTLQFKLVVVFLFIALTSATIYFYGKINSIVIVITLAYVFSLMYYIFHRTREEQKKIG